MSTATLSRPAAPTAYDVRELVRGFHPGWFGAVMGTGIVGVAAYLNPGGIHALLRPAHAVGIAVVIVAWLLAAVIAVPYLLRIARHPDAAAADLRHPLVGGLYATLPAALLVLAVATATVGGSLLPTHATVAVVAVLSVVGCVLALAAAVSFTYLLFSGEQLAPEVANGGWFIPPVVAVIVPLALLPLLPHVGPRAGRLLLLAGYGSLGLGLFLYLLVAAVLFGRLVFHPLPPAPLAPSLWIGLGPIGVGVLALLRLAPAGQPYWGPETAAVQNVSTLAAATLWGFGLWWLATAALLLARYARRGRLPFGVGLWGLTFPLGAYTVATLQLGRAWPTGALEWASVALFLALVGFWLFVAARTLAAVHTGEAWQR